MKKIELLMLDPGAMDGALECNAPGFSREILESWSVMDNEAGLKSWNETKVKNTPAEISHDAPELADEGRHAGRSWAIRQVSNRAGN